MDQEKYLNMSNQQRGVFNATQNLTSPGCIPGFYSKAQAMILNKDGLRQDTRFTQQGAKMVTVGDKAKAIIYGDREKTFGKPESNLGKISQLWGAYLDKELTPYDVSNMMMLLKIARLQNANGHEDSLVDVVGYALIQERMKDADKVVTNT